MRTSLTQITGMPFLMAVTPTSQMEQGVEYTVRYNQQTQTVYCMGGVGYIGTKSLKMELTNKVRPDYKNKIDDQKRK